MLESRGQTVKVLKDKPARSALESNPSVTNTAAIANEILNDMQRENGGDTISEDVSRYQVTVHRPEAKDVPDWVGEVIGPPSVIEQKTVTVVTGGKMLVVLDKTNKKLWQSDLTYNVSRGFGFEDAETSDISLGEGPCVERGDALYVFDAASLTAYDLNSGSVRWRVPSIGIAGLFFDDQNTMYVNSTTADLDSLRFSRQIDINKKTSASVLHVDCKTGKVLWNVQPGGLVSHVDGKFIFCFASKQAADLDPDSLTTLPGMLDSAMDLRRLDSKTGKVTWDYSEKRCPVSVHFKGNIVELVFRKEVEVLKFISF
jgi:outer membrane protein assembly factor BamB